MNVLVTSSTGLTGQAIVSHLAKRGARVRAMIHSEKNAAKMLEIGAAETVTASIDDARDMRRAMTGIDSIVYICPTAHPHESEAGIMAVEIASALGVKRFVYQSVHNSIEPGLIHHRRKLAVEQKLLESDLLYTILRPSAFMQNIIPTLSGITDNHIFSQRFYVNAVDTNRINLIDVEDYGEICAKVTLDESYVYAQLDLCGPQNLSAKDMLEILSETVGAEIRLHYIKDEDFIRNALSRNMPQYTIDVLVAMFNSYNRYGLLGNPFDTSTLLGRMPNDFRTFVSKALSQD